MKYNYGWAVLGLVIIIGSSITYAEIINNYFQNLANLVQYVASLYIISILIGMLMIVIQIEKILITQKNLKLSNNSTSIDLRSLTYDLFAKMKYKKIKLSGVFF